MKFTRPISALSKNDVTIAGGKGASLGEMTQAGMPVPPGFVVLSTAFEQFMEETEIFADIDAILHKVNHKDIDSVEIASEEIQAIILSKKMPNDIENEIKDSFKKLNLTYVAVRSSATSEDSSTAAWAGQLDSYLNTPENKLIEKIKKCWASLFTPRAIFYRFEKNLHKHKISVAVVVQKMVESEVSGVAFSVHPVTQDTNQMIIEAVYGLGEAIVSGQVTPDSYVVEKKARSILDKNIVTKERGLFKSAKGGDEWKSIPEKKQELAALNDNEILELSELILNIENHYRFPCDIEWAKEKGKFYIVQSRPITTLIEKGNETYEKIFTRDFSLPMLDVWYRGEAYNPKPWSGEKQAFLPYIVFVREKGTVKSYYNPKGVEWIKNHIKESIKKNKNFLKILEKEVKQKLKPIQHIYDNEKTLSKKDLLKFIDNFEAAYPWVEAMWWLCEMSEEELSGINISAIRKLRKITTKLSTGTDIIVRKSLLKIFPKIKDYIHVLTLEEIKSEKIPPIQELKKRDAGFIYTETKLYAGATKEHIENKYNLYLERDVANMGSPIKGTTAYNGFVRGKVRRIMGHEHINLIKKGEILVSPMTMPDFLPAMKKAAAFVTDEGGLTCHAAIVAREMKKPCIVGTKIATILLKDGDLVEVDANKSIVRIIKK
jgi:phosphoenolpyruvate synthase/pyruvate phosphate dikinase